MYNLNPLELQKEPWDSVIDLYADIRHMQIREKKKNAKDNWKEQMRAKGYEVKRANDNSGWW